MTLFDTLVAVRDENLSLQMCEKYRDSLIHFKTDLHRAIAELKKKRALYLLSSTEPTAIGKKMHWEASEEGQQLISYEGDIAGLGGEIDALQGKIYSLIR